MRTAEGATSKWFMFYQEQLTPKIQRKVKVFISSQSGVESDMLFCFTLYIFSLLLPYTLQSGKAS